MGPSEEESIDSGTSEEIMNMHDRPLLLTVKGHLYDVAMFGKKHPGGEKILLRVAGGDVDEYMNGSKRIMGVKHQHSDAAYAMLERYSLDRVFKEEDELLNGGPMLYKVGELKDRYWTWIHQPYEGSLRLFESDMLENLTRTSWWVVPMVWIPVVLIFSIRSWYDLFDLYGMMGGLCIWAILFAVGILIWTFFEYIIHRFLFHWQPRPDSSNEILLHFLLHGLHHKTPMDGDRLVFPPVPALVFVVFFYIIYSSLLPYHIFCAFGAGKLFGYIIYDTTHYYLHHGDPPPKTNRHFLKVYHHNHHFKNYDLAFGISTTIWDRVFDTVGDGPL
ncbi:hypothetical protein AB6A40_006193 [Gnathostoma spinigerum]|uniref:Fatty acid 2-hydroxylase n=1 Tax=Gnathostoma spinigerum TaxID=75299 RepID=A0ABD6EHM9_9BILA